MKTTEYLYERLAQIAKEAKESIVEILKKNNITSVNFVPYINENYIDNYVFYDMDKHGYAAWALGVETLCYKKGKVTLDMSENEGGFFESCNLDNLSAQEIIYVLEMLEGVIEHSKEEHIPILEKGQDFDDAIPEVPDSLKNIKGFDYAGMHFIPAGTFKDHGIKDVFKECNRLKHDPNYPLIPASEWSHKDFYASSDSAPDDIFWLEDKGFYVCPGGSCLFKIDIDNKND